MINKAIATDAAHLNRRERHAVADQRHKVSHPCTAHDIAEIDAEVRAVPD